MWWRPCGMCRPAVALALLLACVTPALADEAMDIVRADSTGDYDARLLGEEAVESVACHVLDLKAKTKDVTYAAVKYWVTKDGRRPVKAEFFAATGTLLKTGTFDEFKEAVPGHPLATRLTLVDGIRKDRRSVLDYGEVVVRDIPEKYFDKSS